MPKSKGVVFEYTYIYIYTHMYINIYTQCTLLTDNQMNMSLATTDYIYND